MVCKADGAFEIAMVGVVRVGEPGLNRTRDVLTKERSQVREANADYAETTLNVQPEARFDETPCWSDQF